MTPLPFHNNTVVAEIIIVMAVRATSLFRHIPGESYKAKHFPYLHF